MKNNFQNEIPRSRINLSVDLRVDGKTKTVSLPHKTLVLGNFSGVNNPLPVIDRERKRVTKDTLDNAMENIRPQLQLVVEDKTIDLQFKSIKDFHPESLVLQVPELKKMLAIRHLLKDLRAQLSENPALKENLTKMLHLKDRIDNVHEKNE